MTAAERLAEIAEILAAGYLRSLARRNHVEKTLGESRCPTAHVSERGRATKGKTEIGIA